MTILADLIARREAYRAAELKALASQEYQIGSAGHARRSRMADLEQIRLQINLLDKQIESVQAVVSGTRRVRYFRTC